MFEKLQKIKERFEEVYRLLQLPETVSDQELYRDLNKEYKNLSPIVEEFDRYLSYKEEEEEAEEILSDPSSDDDLREMAEMQKEEFTYEKNDGCYSVPCDAALRSGCDCGIRRKSHAGHHQH